MLTASNELIQANIGGYHVTLDQVPPSLGAKNSSPILYVDYGRRWSISLQMRQWEFVRQLVTNHPRAFDLRRFDRQGYFNYVTISKTRKIIASACPLEIVSLGSQRFRLEAK